MQLPTIAIVGPRGEERVINLADYDEATMTRWESRGLAAAPPRPVPPPDEEEALLGQRRKRGRPPGPRGRR